MRVAVAQLRTGPDPFENLLALHDFVLEAQSQNVQLISFPENAIYRGPRKGLLKDFQLSLDSEGALQKKSELAHALSELRQEWRIHVSLGSVPESSDLEGKPFNAHWLLNPGGKISSYKKIHLFDFSGSQGVYRESDECSRGENLLTVDCADFRVGLSICYDLRFPELYRQMVLGQKANLILVPAAFTYETGKAHWHSLLRSRAIENLSYVMAAGQWGTHLNNEGKEMRCFGHSLIISPWGEILAEGPEDGDELLIADLSLQSMSEARTRLPALSTAKLWRSL